MAEPKRDFATEELIQSAEAELGVTFPAELKAIWRVHNEMNCPEDGDSFLYLIRPTRERPRVR
jgi:cell wall assembly regulator SMI1